MKAIYKLVLFFAILQVVAPMVTVMNIFPTTLYSDIELGSMDDPNSLPTAEELFSMLFAPDDTIFGLPTISLYVVMIAFTTLGTGIAIVTKSWVPVVITLLGWSVVPMINTSRTFFEKILYTWNAPSLIYLALIFGLGIIILLVITAIETATHGDV